MKMITSLASFVLLSSICFADQAAWVTKAHADAAIKIIKRSGMVRHYCEPCGEKKYRAEKVFDSTAARVEPDSGYYEVSVNGTPVDLAYIYVSIGGKWTNVAMQLKIPVSGVSRIMKSTVKEQQLNEGGRTEMKNFELESGEVGE